MEKLFANKFALAVLCFVLGGFSVWGVNRYIEHKKEPDRVFVFPLKQGADRFFNDFFNNEFFDRSRDPFEEMRRMQEQMLKQFGEQDEFRGSFRNWFQKRFGGGDVGDIKQREDDKFVYYDIELRDETPKELKVEVNDGQVEISGQIETKQDEQGSKNYISRTFHRSFPVPANVDSESFKLTQEAKKIIIKFSKRKT